MIMPIPTSGSLLLVYVAISVMGPLVLLPVMLLLERRLGSKRVRREGPVVHFPSRVQRIARRRLMRLSPDPDRPQPRSPSRKPHTDKRKRKL